MDTTVFAALVGGFGGLLTVVIGVLASDALDARRDLAVAEAQWAKERSRQAQEAAKTLPTLMNENLVIEQQPTVVWATADDLLSRAT